ncbi:DUF2971 domain-containing protein [Kiloniella majae]|uniref:DUF2971 domain-containing protein n=1 Tax=Kiloniella majae TaxID=1938558 RepID=UPI000A27908B|nr:DUF2971 domain-containing protein [Kiloniella majae]
MTADFISQDPPEFLYKYRALSNPDDLRKVSEIFTHKRLYCATPSQFNDPFDCCPAYSWEASSYARKLYLRDLIEEDARKFTKSQTRKKVRQGLKRLRKQSTDNELFNKGKNDARKLLANVSRVLSLSANCSNILMWSHYGGNHEGICLRLNLVNSRSRLKNAFPVFYEENRPIINLIKDNDELRYKKALLTKSSQWAYEKEYRLIEIPPKNNISRKVRKFFYFPPEALDAVILGSNISSSNEIFIRKLITEYPTEIKIVRAQMSDTEYGLDIKEL